jgi:AcrR family transcriptional regulator
MATSRKRGRPARVDAALIADAVLDIGIADATMRNVAERLGVSAQSLYHHVKGVDGLHRLATERALERIPAPAFDGQHWDRWLRDWAEFIRIGLAEQPEYLTQYMVGAIEDDEMTLVSDALEALCGLGLSATDALRVCSAVTNLAIGDAVYAARERSLGSDRRPWRARLFAFVASGPPEEHVALRALGLAGTQPCTQEAFDMQFDLLLTGIAVRHGLERGN